VALSDRERWDQRYTDPRQQLDRGPNALLPRCVPPAPAGAPAEPGARALDLACGLGHNALWLAAQGYHVEAIDISVAALRHARGEMLRRGLQGVTFIAADLDEFPLPPAAYDVVCVFRFLDRGLFPAIRACVRPGGLVVYQTFNVGRLRLHPTFSPDHMLALGELPGFFPGWTPILSADVWASGTDEDDTISTFVGRKP
jgi:tellurite methyltransferase